MSNYVLVGNGDKKTRHDLAVMTASTKTGGQGNVYFPDRKTCIKVLHDPNDFTVQLANISKLLLNSAKPYEQVRSVSAAPLELVWDESAQKIVGYTMEQLTGWRGFHEIETEADSESNGVDLRSSGLLLAELSKNIRVVHSLGFVIGDLNPSNVLFKCEGYDRFLVKIIDVDSWSICRKGDLGIEYASKVLDTGVIYHPDIIQADRNKRPWPDFTPLHDWWAFAYIGWMILTKYDPFTTGMATDEDKEDRIIEGHTANSASAVKLRPDCGPAAQALGPKLRFHLDRCLKNKVQRPFPTKILEDFANNLCRCKKCNFTAHKSAIICPHCATIL